MTQSIPKSTPWLLLFGRAALFLAIQALFALGFSLAGRARAWEAGAAFWAFVVTITNLICLAAMVTLFRGEGKNYWEIFRIRRETIKADLLPLIGTLVIAGPLGFLPNVILAAWLFGDSQTALNLLLRPLPFWAVYASLILFPLTQGLVEIPNYFLYVMPRLEAQGLRPGLAITLPAVMLGLQHMAVPFVFDIRYLTWRGLMFIPFAFMVGIVIHWRPRLLPYLAITHVLMDASFAAMLLPMGY